jgi:conjugal transfer pilus assembly protein TraV
MTKAKAALCAAMATLAMSGCQSLSGLDATDKFTCKATGGVACESMTEIHERTRAGTLPAQQKKEKPVGSTMPKARTDATPLSTALVATTGMTPALSTGMPLLTQPTALRIWLAPWKDADGDLHDQSYIYVKTGEVDWVQQHTRQQIITTFAPRRVSGAITKAPEEVKKTQQGDAADIAAQARAMMKSEAEQASGASEISVETIKKLLAPQ